ncbi:MAG: hypothetical protein HOH43_17995, partial [Candidatus Latescibacteria bacterium]|nr:hypothetical protein [Candidatus Latescibacterota bacterium]
YPRHGGRDAATFDLTFTAPKELKLISVGDLQHSESKGVMTTSRWLTKGAIRNAAFNIGYYNPHEIQDFGMVPITVLAIEDNRGDLDQEVSDDVVGSFKLFRQQFGQVQADRLYVTETPFPHGLAFPGMLHLSWSGTLDLSPRGYEAVFRAHEVAHQWWGIDVDFTSYHDQWLSEGLATYCGLLFLETEQDGFERYIDLLRIWKKHIIEISDGPSRGGRQAGPLWLGYRNSSAIMGINYSTIVYQKGAWVFHMLRSYMRDLDTGSDGRFLAGLREYYDKYRGKQASTSDFQQIMEEHAGSDLGWFFNQWVYGAEIPTYLFSYRVEQVAGNRYVVHCKVGQGNVPREFQMAVPITIESEDGMRTTVRVPIQGVGAQFELPAVRSKPKKILFNDMESVLCRVEQVPWYRF